MPLMTIGKCFKGRKDCESFDVIEAGDDMSDNDEQDLTHLLKVITTALAVIATRRVARGQGAGYPVTAARRPVRSMQWSPISSRGSNDRSAA